MNSQFNHPFVWRKSIVSSFCEIPLEAGSKYLSIEIQTARSEQGAGCIVILHVEPGVIDILFDKALGLTRSWAETEPSTAHLRCRNILERDLSETICSVGGRDVVVEACFLDADDEEVEFRVKAVKKKKSKPIFTPAPPRGQAKCLRFLIMDDFSLLGVDSDIQISISGERQGIRYFLLNKTFARYTGGRVGADFLLTALYVNARLSEQLSENEADGGLVVSDGSRWMAMEGFLAQDVQSLLSDEAATVSKVSIDSSLGRLATAVLKVESLSEKRKMLRMEKIKQDWVPRELSITRHLMRLMRLYNRRKELRSCEIDYEWHGQWVTVGHKWLVA